jgi:hypothetical protein
MAALLLAGAIEYYVGFHGNKEKVSQLSNGIEALSSEVRSGN